jgi:Adenylate and Guanylate cyclase catalytic domain
MGYVLSIQKGFTAWSSVREPFQVFTLLETIYHAFDKIARRRKIFKVETVGDCYIAVCGVPDPVPRHAGMYYHPKVVSSGVRKYCVVNYLIVCRICCCCRLIVGIYVVVMARFSRECMYKIWSLTQKLESTLGPDTGTY